MYLDSAEKDSMEKAVLSFYMARFWYVLDRVEKVSSWTTLIVAVLALSSLGMIFWWLPSDERPFWISFLPVLFLVVVFRVLAWWRKKAWARQREGEQYDIQFGEIDQVQASLEEREVFLRLLAAIHASDIEQLKLAVDEAVHLPNLSQLRFVRDLQADLPGMFPQKQ